MHLVTSKSDHPNGFIATYIRKVSQSPAVQPYLVASMELSVFQEPPNGAAEGSFPSSMALFFHAGTSSSFL